MRMITESFRKEEAPLQTVSGQNAHRSAVVATSESRGSAFARVEEGAPWGHTVARGRCRRQGGGTGDGSAATPAATTTRSAGGSPRLISENAVCIPDMAHGGTGAVVNNSTIGRHFDGLSGDSTRAGKVDWATTPKCPHACRGSPAHLVNSLCEAGDGVCGGGVELPKVVQVDGQRYSGLPHEPGQVGSHEHSVADCHACDGVAVEGRARNGSKSEPGCA